MEVAAGRGKDLGASGPVGGAEAETWVAWIVSGYLASWPEQWQDVEGAEDADSGMVVDNLLVVEDAASAPALQLEDCRMAGSARMHKSAEEEVLGYVVDDLVEPN